MRGQLRAGELFVDRPVGVVADEQIQAIAVDGEWQPVLGEDVAKERGIAMDVLGRPKLQRQDLAGGIVDGAE